MASLFEELGAFDRPWVDVTVRIGSAERQMLARVPSASEQDAIDAFYMDEFSRILMDNVVAKDGKISERDRVADIYRTRSKEDIVEQLIPTRSLELKERVQALTGILIGAETLRLQAIEDDEERKIEAEALDIRWKEGEDIVRKEIAEELGYEDFDLLVKRLAEVNINLKVQMTAKKNTNARFLLSSLYFRNPDGSAGEPAFKSIEEVSQFKAETIESLTAQVQAALQKGADLPLESPAGEEPGKPLLSQSISEAATPISGEPIATTPAV